MATAKSKEQFVRAWKAEINQFSTLYWNCPNDQEMWNELQEVQAKLESIVLRIADKCEWEGEDNGNQD